MLKAGTVEMHTEEGMPKEWQMSSKVLWFHCALEVPGTSLPLLIQDLWMLQIASNLSKRCWNRGPSACLWRWLFHLPRTGLRRPPHPSHPTSASAPGAISVGVQV